ncbi:PAS domain S-box protein [Halovenus marina]|uniref:PAS domain S-box protein n=1 Tax=Halovenus marina TaxID=3396621 RepID=UPI003F560AE6
MRESEAPKSIQGELLYEAIEQTTDAVYVTDPEGVIEYVNPAFEEITGYERTDVVGKTPRVLKSGEQDESYYKELWETIRSEERWEMEIVDETKEGERIVLDQTISPITTADGEIAKFVAVARDITERKSRERELELFKQLQSRVLRHNLRNYLTIVMLHAETMSQRLDAEHAELAESVLSAANELETLTEKTRTIERLLDQQLTRTTLTLEAELRSLVDRYREQFPTVSFTVGCPEGCQVWTVPEVSLVFENLLDNAARYNTSRDPTVDVTVATDDSAVAVSISDNGPGIAEQELRALTENDATALNHETGIGLWVVTWVIDRTAASLSYETGDTGTTITIDFPRQSGPEDSTC